MAKISVIPNDEVLPPVDFPDQYPETKLILRKLKQVVQAENAANLARPAQPSRVAEISSLALAAERAFKRERDTVLR